MYNREMSIPNSIEQFGKGKSDGQHFQQSPTASHNAEACTRIHTIPLFITK